jgi:hypothetical protein
MLIALSLPSPLFEDVVDRDPVLALPLLERGLLQNFDPAEWTDQEALASVTDELISALDHETKMFGDSRYCSLTGFHWGQAMGNEGYRRLTEKLVNTGLVRHNDSTGLFLMPEDLRRHILLMWFKVLATAAAPRNIRIHPVAELAVTDDLLDQYFHHSSGPRFLNQMATGSYFLHDMAALYLDLSTVPLDEILDFRAQHGVQYRAYLADLLAYVERAAREYDPAFHATREEVIIDQWNELERLTRKTFSKRAGVAALSLLASVWSGSRGDPLGAILAGMTALLALPEMPSPPPQFAYLFTVRNELSR